MLALVPEIKRKSLARAGSKKAIFLSTVSYAATYDEAKIKDFQNTLLLTTEYMLYIFGLSYRY